MHRVAHPQTQPVGLAAWQDDGPAAVERRERRGPVTRGEYESAIGQQVPPGQRGGIETDALVGDRE
jgi:hypothetical protein